mgnify:CR=1 FL=1
MKPIKLTKKQFIDEGAFAKVYRISPRRIVKVFKDQDNEEYGRNLQDEIAGSKMHEACLPILKVVEVILPNSRRSRKALLKRYIPYEVSEGEFYKKYNPHNYSIFWDIKRRNIRKDSKGRIYLIDTQTHACMDLN